MGKKKGEGPAAPAAPFNNPFGALKGVIAIAGPGPEAKPVAEPKTPKGPARALVRYERKGHGGKEVTLVEQLELSLVQRETWCKELKQALGCGGRVDGDALMLQGDQRERLPKMLEARGVRKVTVS